MDNAVPLELNEIVLRSLKAAEELQSQIEALSPANTLTKPSWEGLVQAHIAHVLNHAAIIKHAISISSNNPAVMAALQAMETTSEQMIKGTPALHNHVLVSSLRHLFTGPTLMWDLSLTSSSGYKPLRSEA